MKLTIKNLIQDSVSSAMLDNLKDQLSNRDGFQLIAEENPPRDGEKGVFTVLISFAITILENITATLLVDYLKNVFHKNRKPDHYRWELVIETDNSSEVAEYRIVVFKKDGAILVQQITPEALPEG